MIEINASDLVSHGEIKLRNVAYGRTVQYGWLVRRNKAEFLKGVVRPYKPNAEDIEQIVKRSGRMHIVSLSADHLVIDQGFQKEVKDLSRRPLVPGINP